MPPAQRPGSVLFFRITRGLRPVATNMPPVARAQSLLRLRRRELHIRTSSFACLGVAQNGRILSEDGYFPLGEQRCARERMLRIGNSVLRTREHRSCAARGPPAARAQGAGSLARGNFLAAHMPPKSPGTGRHNRSEAREGLVWKEHDMRARPMGGRHKAGRYSSLSVSTHPRTLFFTRKRANSSCAEVVRW